MMRALHVIPAVASRYGGPSAAIAPMCRALAARGVDTLIVSTNADGRTQLPVVVGKPTRWDGVPALFFERQFSESFKYSPALARWIREHAREFDVVHIHAVLSHACLAAAAACRRQGIPYVVRPLGTLAPWSLGQKSLKKRALLRLGAARAVLDASVIHCTSQEERRGIEAEFPGARCAVVPLGIDPEWLDPPVDASGPNADPYILTISRLHPKKNLDTLIEAFLGVRSAQGGWRLVIAGSGEADYATALRDLARERGGATSVSFPGWIDGADKRALIRNASAFALTSFHENFGVSVLEAMAAGVPPVVSSSVDLAADIAAARAGWVVNTSLDSIRAGLADAMGSATERVFRGNAARRLATRFAWPVIAHDLIALYETLRRAGPARTGVHASAATARP